MDHHVYAVLEQPSNQVALILVSYIILLLYMHWLNFDSLKL